MNIKKATEENIKEAASIIRNGGLVAFPTETVYGLGANGLDSIASSKIFEAKMRPHFDPLILHIYDRDQIQDIAVLNNPDIDKLLDAFWPGPLTIVLPKKDSVPDLITSGHSTVAIRMPSHEVARLLLKETGLPVAAPSANRFGCLSPTTAEHVNSQLSGRIDYILDGGACNVGVESTIMSLEDDRFELLRPGGLPLEEIEKVIGKVHIKKSDGKNPNAPGMLKSHYAPKTRLILFNGENLPEEIIGKKTGALLFKENKANYKFDAVRVLSERADLREASSNLFKYLHELENLDLELIIAETIQEQGLGRAIMDRLSKAAYKHRTA